MPPSVATRPARADGKPTSRSCPSATSLTLREQLAQMLFVTVMGDSPTQLRRLVDRPEPVGGIFVSGVSTRVFRDGALRALASSRIPPLVAVDEEGGRVQRIDAIAGSLPAARLLGRRSPGQIYALARERGRRLAALGVTMDFAPVVDLGGQPADAVIGDRAFAGTVSGVVRSAGAFAAGLRVGGVVPTLKHFPGHGRARGDSHRGPAVTPSWSSVQRVDVAPYRILLGLQPTAVMVGHLTVPGLSAPGVPTSLDPRVYAYLRTDLAFSGLVVTDDLSGMRAVTNRFSLTGAARSALAAGADMALLTPTSLDGLLDTLARDVSRGELPRARVVQAVQHVLALKKCHS